MKKIIGAVTVSALGLFLKADAALAQSGREQVDSIANDGGLLDLSFGGGIAGFIYTVTMSLIAITGVLSVLFIIIGGFQYITSGSNAELAKKGKSTILNAVIGLVVVLLSYTIISVVYTTFAT